MFEITTTEVQPGTVVPRPRWSPPIQPEHECFIRLLQMFGPAVILFSGPKRSGKTTASQWVANELGEPVRLLDNLDEALGKPGTVEHAETTGKLMRLLQEHSAGVLIVCTNNKKDLDPGILARCHRVVDF